MNTSDMIKVLSSYVDDTPITDDAIRWFNLGKDKMAIEVRATFPDLPLSAVDTALSSSFVFDTKYHEIPVMYAAAMYKAQDASLREHQNFMSQFLSALANFSENYDPPVQYRDDPNCQQFTATDGQTVFTVTKRDYDPTYSNVQVFQNGGILDSTDYEVATDGTKTVTLTTGAVAGDTITVVWDTHGDFQNPPLPWWNF